MAPAPAPTDAQPVRFVLSDRQRLSWLRLYRSENVGPATFRDLINHCGSAETALVLLPELAKRGGRASTIGICSQDDAEAEIEAIEKAGARLVGLGEPDYPPLLRQMDQAPALITIKGNAAVFNQRAVAIVGSRNASMAGLRIARMIAADLGKAGCTVISGLARGIDHAAHEATLATGTVAVLAGGIDQPYPPENIPLLERITSGEHGCAITEKRFGHEPKARDFPRRNRLIAGLALGTVVVEAAIRSGSLITARLAGEAGRIVMAVPGSPLDPRAHGTNGLIRDGAILVTSAAEVLEAVTPIAGGTSTQPPQFLEPEGTMTLPPDDDARARIVSLLGPVPCDLDDLIAETGLSPSQVFLVVLELDLASRIERHSGNRVALLPG